MTKLGQGPKKLIKLIGLIMLMLPFQKSNAQQLDGAVKNHEFNLEIQSYLKFSVPIITVDSLEKSSEKVVLLDAREKEEYEVSHLKGAIHIGYEEFELSKLVNIPKDQQIVVYCSIGYRSEKIGKKLRKSGYKNVTNLYGSIFEWVNQENKIYKDNEEETLQLHTYNQKWSKWVSNPKIEKIW